MEVTDVDKLMEGDLGQWLEEKAEERVKAKATAWRRFFVGAPIAAILIFAVWHLIGAETNDDVGLSICLTIVIAAVPLGIALRPIANATMGMKDGINKAIAAELGLDYSMQVPPGSKGRGAGWEPAKLYGLLPEYNRSSFQDCWWGELEGHEFRAFETRLSYSGDSNSSSTGTEKFRGCIVQIAFGRPFTSTTLLQRKGGFASLFGSRDSKKKRSYQLDLVDMVHPAFGDLFEVYSDDQVEARTLIHPSYIEQLMEIERAFGGIKARALFHATEEGGLVVIAVETDNLFESGGLNPDKDRAKVERTAEQFASLARLAMAFNQNERGRVAARPVERARMVDKFS